jgi:hypothetical protein
MPELARLGVRVWTAGLSWRQVAATRPTSPQDPTDPAYAWPPTIDAAVSDAAANGIDPVLYVQDFPGWSNGGKPGAWAPTSAADYADFLVAAMRHYPLVRRWQIISEPTKGSNFQPQGGDGTTAPRRYALLLEAAYAAMHAERADVVVIGGNTHNVGANNAASTNPETFLREMRLPNGSRPRFDLLGINPYTERSPRITLEKRDPIIDIADLDWLFKKLDVWYPAAKQPGGKPVRLFIGEFAWLTEHGNIYWLYSMSRAKQASWMRPAFRIAANTRRVDTMCWYQLYDAPPVAGEEKALIPSNWTSGLRTASGTRKPSYDVFRKLPRGPKQLIVGAVPPAGG